MGYFNRLNSDYSTGSSGQSHPTDTTSAYKCLTIVRRHVITFNDIWHGFCQGQVESWRTQTANLTDITTCSQCPEGIAKDSWVEVDNITISEGLTLFPSINTDQDQYGTDDICDVCDRGDWPDNEDAGLPGQFPIGEKKTKFIYTEVEKMCLTTPLQVLLAERDLADMNFSEHLDFPCHLPTASEGMGLVTQIGDCLCLQCQGGEAGRQKIQTFLDALVTCTNNIMGRTKSLSNSQTEKQKERAWEACVQAAADELCKP